MSKVDTNQAKFFPFLSSPQVQASAHQQITLKGVHAVCTLDNIRGVVPHAKNYQ